MQRPAALLALVLVLASCQSSAEPDPATQTTALAPAAPTGSEPTNSDDPYLVYLDLAPPDAQVDLSRDDAMARALLGCGQAWPPGTVDAALAEAYGHLCP